MSHNLIRAMQKMRCKMGTEPHVSDSDSEAWKLTNLPPEVSLCGLSKQLEEYRVQKKYQGLFLFGISIT